MSERGWIEPGQRRVRFADAEGNIVHECDETCDHDGEDDDDE